MATTNVQQRPSLQEQVQYYQHLFLMYGATDPDDPRPALVKRIREGHWREVIRDADAEPDTLPRDPRTWLVLVNAHLLAGTLARARTLSRAAEEYYRSQKDVVGEATSIAQQGRVAWREEGFAAAMAWMRTARKKDRKCITAWVGELCYASMERDEETLIARLKEFLTIFPHWEEIEPLLRLFRDDSQLAWARRRPAFAPIMQTLRQLRQL